MLCNISYAISSTLRSGTSRGAYSVRPALNQSTACSSANHLDSFLEEKIGVPQDDVLAYLSDGRRLHKDSIRDLAGVQDQARPPPSPCSRAYVRPYRPSMYSTSAI